MSAPRRREGAGQDALTVNTWTGAANILCGRVCVCVRARTRAHTHTRADKFTNPVVSQEDTLGCGTQETKCKWFNQEVTLSCGWAKNQSVRVPLGLSCGLVVVAVWVGLFLLSLPANLGEARSCREAGMY